MKPPESTLHRGPLVRTVLAFCAAVRDSRTEDACLLVDPKVICFALVRPGLSVYRGHGGVASLVTYVHAAYGHYQIEIDEITEAPGAEVTVRARILPEPGYQQPPPPIVTRYTFCDGLITSIESEPCPRIR